MVYVERQFSQEQNLGSVLSACVVLGFKITIIWNELAKGFSMRLDMLSWKVERTLQMEMSRSFGWKT